MLGFAPSMRSPVAVSCLFVSVVWCFGAVSAAGAQDTTVRLEGEGRLGPAADDYRGTSASYGYEGTPPSVVPEMIELAHVGSDDVIRSTSPGAAMRAC